MTISLPRRATAEFLGTGILTAAVVGSGIMAERLASGNPALALLANSIATGAALVALILALGPVSGAHINPVVSLTEALCGRMTWTETPLYLCSQISGACCGTILANLMFSLPAVSLSQRARSGPAQWLSEVVATFGLVLVIHGTVRFRPNHVPYAVASYVTAAYWFTASTAFANPAITIARTLSNTFAGIRSADVLPFVLAQLVGGLAAVLLFRPVMDEPMCPLRHSSASSSSLNEPSLAPVAGHRAGKL